MNLKFACLVIAIGGLFGSSAALAKGYAERGVVEVRGDFEFGYSSSDMQLEVIPYGGTFTRRVSQIHLAASPRFAIFVARGLSLNLGATGNYASAQTPSTLVGMIGGVGYCFAMGPVFAGPEVELGYALGKGSSKWDVSNVTGGASFLFKLPVGGGIVTLGPKLSASTMSLGTGGSLKSSDLRVALGYGVFF